MTFFENQPGVVKYKYFDISYNGLSATVGAQRYSTGQSLQYSFNQGVINPGLEITIDTNAGTMTHTG
ncbi:hypothetical protein KCU78_g2544, partial [Aureobasidium melanogenum]